MNIEYRNEDLELRVERYEINKSPAISLYTMGGELHTTITVCDERVFLMPDEVLIKTWSENEKVPTLADGKLFRDTERRIKSGFVEMQIWEVVDKELLLEIVSGY